MKGLRVSKYQQSLTEKATLSLVQFSSAQMITEIWFENLSMLLLVVFKI